MTLVELLQQRQWLRWKNYNGKKPPVDAAGRLRANWMDAQTWLTGEEALSVNYGDGAGVVITSGIGGIDLDSCRQPDGQVDARALAILEQLPAGTYVEVSPSGEGLKAFTRSAGWLEFNFSDPDRIRLTKDLQASGYFAFTGSAFGAEPVSGWLIPECDLDAIAAPYRDASRPVAGKQRSVLPPVVLPGGQESTMFKEACALRARGYDEDAISSALWGLVQAGRFPAAPGKEPWTLDDCRAKARSAMRYVPGEGGDRNKDGRLLPTPDSLRWAFEQAGVVFRYNAFTKEKIVLCDGSEAAITDSTINRLRFGFSSAHGVLFPKEMVFDFVDVLCHENTYHPVRDYLDSLEWDGTPRLDNWLATYLDAEDTPYTRAVGALVLIAAVRRVRQPGCKFDEMLILEGGQGLGKSTAVQALLPNPKWYTDSLPLGSDAKVTIERTMGVWFVEASELHGYGKREVEHLKQFLSAQTDGPVRMAYAREPVKEPRQFVMIGTTNQDVYLRDSTGGRRFWPVRVAISRMCDGPRVAGDRDQLWAEAAKREAEGESIRLPAALWPEAGKAQEERHEVDPWEELLADALGQAEGRVLTDNLWRIVGVEREHRDQRGGTRLHGCMRRLGFARRQFMTRGIKRWGWVRGKGGEWILPPAGPEEEL